VLIVAPVTRNHLIVDQNLIVVKISA